MRKWASYSVCGEMLLDTPVMLSWLLGNRRLRREIRELMATSACMVSVASISKAAVKHCIGKLSRDPMRLRAHSLAVGTRQLAIDDPHTIEPASLHGLHEGPFDR